MELYCEEYKKTLALVDTNISVIGESQFTDVENYHCLNSYDINLVLDELNVKVVKEQLYCLLIHNGVPMYRGRLVLISNDEYSLKVVFQGLPANGCFSKFKFRERLSDYFATGKGEANDITTPADMFFYNNNKKKLEWNIRGVDTGLDCPITMLNYGRYLKHTIPCFTDVNAGLNSLIRNYPMITPTIDVGTSGKLIKYNTAGTYQGFGYINTSKLLRAIGIDVPELGSHLNGMLTWVSAKSRYLLKIYMRQYTVTDGSNWWHEYHSDSNTVIYLQDNDTGVWDDTKPFYDVSNYFKYSIRRAVQVTNPRNRESYFPFDVTIQRVDWLYDAKYSDKEVFYDRRDETVELDGKTYNVTRQDIQGGLQYKAGTEFFIPEGVYRSNIPVLEQAYSYCVAYVDCEYDIDYFTYLKFITHFTDIPILLNQLNCLNVSTNQFLSELSLNCRTYNKLRNPLFVTNYNKDIVHNMDGVDVRGVFNLLDSNVITTAVEVDDEADKLITVGFENSKYGSSIDKHLNNNSLAGIKTVMQKFVGANYVSNADRTKAVPPFYFACASNVLNIQTVATFNAEYRSQSIIGFFCRADRECVETTSTAPMNYWDMYYQTDLSANWKTNNYMLTKDDSNYDYLQFYPNKERKYTVTCTGYKLEDIVEWAGERFVVDSFRTEDFVQWTLTLYKI